MKIERNADSERVKNFEIDFPKAAALIVSKLGEKPFHVKAPLNSSALDSVFCTILKTVNLPHDDLKLRWEILKQDKTFQDTTYYGTSDTSIIKIRFERAWEILINSTSSSDPLNQEN
jgi:hypothetical protein